MRKDSSEVLEFSGVLESSWALVRSMEVIEVAPFPRRAAPFAAWCGTLVVWHLFRVMWHLGSPQCGAAPFPRGVAPSPRGVALFPCGVAPFTLCRCFKVDDQWTVDHLWTNGPSEHEWTLC